MSTREELELAVKSAKVSVGDAEAALGAFNAKAENNVFDDLEKALYKVEGMLESRAHSDCEGSYNCGADTYTQEFIVCGIKYRGTLQVEYNRHDKTYYYIENSSFSYETIVE